MRHISEICTDLNQLLNEFDEAQNLIVSKELSYSTIISVMKSLNKLAERTEGLTIKYCSGRIEHDLSVSGLIRNETEQLSNLLNLALSPGLLEYALLYPGNE